MNIKNIISITLLSFLIHSIVGCGVMSKPEDTDKALNKNPESSRVAEQDMSIKDFIANYSLVDFIISSINSEFTSLLGDNYQIFDNNDSLNDFFTLINNQKYTLQQEDKLRVEQLLLNLQTKNIDFQINSLLFYPFISRRSYQIQELSTLKNHIISIKFDMNETYQEDSFYNILFYQVAKSVKEIMVKKSESEIIIISKEKK